jgi:purine-nucleoside phosphorylase
VVSERALCGDGASRALTGAESIVPDARLTEALSVAAPGATRGTTVSTDLFYDPDASRNDEWVAKGAIGVEMEAAALFAVAARHGVRAGGLLAVSDILVGGRQRLDEETLARVGEELGRVGAGVLTYSA